MYSVAIIEKYIVRRTPAIFRITLPLVDAIQLHNQWHVKKCNTCPLRLDAAKAGGLPSWKDNGVEAMRLMQYFNAITDQVTLIYAWSASWRTVGRQALLQKRQAIKLVDENARRRPMLWLPSR